MNKHILVLGGTGFIGRHAVEALSHLGATVTIGTRFPDRATGSHATRKVIFEQRLEPESWADLVDDFDAILNCVGILRQRGASTYDRVHHLAPAALAHSCETGNKRFVHVSALGLNPDARSRFISSKIRGESRIREGRGDWAIARPSLLDGEGGFGARWLRGVSRLPAFLTPSGAKGRIAALDVRDLGEALANLCMSDPDELRFKQSRIFELGGEKEYVFHEYIRALRATYTSKSSLQIMVPNQLARFFAHFFDVIHFTPFSFGHWEMLQRDNRPETNRLPALLGRRPTPVPLQLDLDSDQ